MLTQVHPLFCSRDVLFELTLRRKCTTFKNQNQTFQQKKKKENRENDLS